MKFAIAIKTAIIIRPYFQAFVVTLITCFSIKANPNFFGLSSNISLKRSGPMSFSMGE
ncbi:hypothetical protein ES705_47321 [subsurface metagenome]